jgi:hypothetical protein
MRLVRGWWRRAGRGDACPRAQRNRRIQQACPGRATAPCARRWQPADPGRGARGTRQTTGPKSRARAAADPDRLRAPRSHWGRCGAPSPTYRSQRQQSANGLPTSRQTPRGARGGFGGGCSVTQRARRPQPPPRMDRRTGTTHGRRPTRSTPRSVCRRLVGPRTRPSPVR